MASPAHIVSLGSFVLILSTPGSVTVKISWVIVVEQPPDDTP